LFIIRGLLSYISVPFYTISLLPYNIADKSITEDNKLCTSEMSRVISKFGCETLQTETRQT